MTRGGQITNLRVGPQKWAGVILLTRAVFDVLEMELPVWKEITG